MPELPDVVVYVEALRERVVGQTLERLRFASPFVLRTVVPTVEEIEGRVVQGVWRVGKRVVIGLSDDLFVVTHLMIAGRFEWGEKGRKIPGKIGLAAFDFSSGTLILREVSQKKRAAVHLVRGHDALRRLQPAGLEVLDADLTAFRDALLRENHTLKRSLTDPRLFSGIGNAYSDEILHAARLSPLKLTRRLSEDEIARLFDACRTTLLQWTDRLRTECAGNFPTKVTAFRDEMAVHGKYGKPCPRCGAPVQRIVYAENEANYCAGCQNAGKLFADRSLSRLLRNEWPRTLEELEEAKEARLSPPRSPADAPSAPARRGRATPPQDRPSTPRKSRSSAREHPDA